MLRLANIITRGPATAAAMTAAALAQPSSSPAECSWFGKSKEVVTLESKNASLKDAVKQLEKDNKILEEKIATTTLWSIFSESAPGSVDMLQYSKQKAEEAIEKGFPQEISYGFAAGGCVGYASKIAFRVTAATTGGVFIFLQLLQYNDLIKINHSRISDLFKSLADLDGDGKIDSADLMLAKEKYMSIMGHGFATGGGFASGFMLGFRRG